MAIGAFGSGFLGGFVPTFQAGLENYQRNEDRKFSRQQSEQQAAQNQQLKMYEVFRDVLASDYPDLAIRGAEGMFGIEFDPDVKKSLLKSKEQDRLLFGEVLGMVDPQLAKLGVSNPKYLLPLLQQALPQVLKMRRELEARQEYQAAGRETAPQEPPTQPIGVAASLPPQAIPGAVPPEGMEQRRPVESRSFEADEMSKLQRKVDELEVKEQYARERGDESLSNATRSQLGKTRTRLDDLTKDTMGTKAVQAWRRAVAEKHRASPETPKDEIRSDAAEEVLATFGPKYFPDQLKPFVTAEARKATETEESRRLDEASDRLFGPGTTYRSLPQADKSRVVREVERDRVTKALTQSYYQGAAGTLVQKPIPTERLQELTDLRGDLNLVSDLFAGMRDPEIAKLVGPMLANPIGSVTRELGKRTGSMTPKQAEFFGLLQSVVQPMVTRIIGASRTQLESAGLKDLIPDVGKDPLSVLIGKIQAIDRFTTARQRATIQTLGEFGFQTPGQAPSIPPLPPELRSRYAPAVPITGAPRQQPKGRGPTRAEMDDALRRSNNNPEAARNLLRSEGFE